MKYLSNFTIPVYRECFYGEPLLGGQKGDLAVAGVSTIKTHSIFVVDFDILRRIILNRSFTKEVSLERKNKTISKQASKQG